MGRNRKSEGEGREGHARKGKGEEEAEEMKCLPIL
jgi:hypothetical protein